MTTVTSPLTGRVVGLTTVPDPVFSAAMVGPGTALEPAAGPATAVAPLAGVVTTLHPHAFVVADGNGRGVLTHLGIDTVQLGGAGFELLTRAGETVACGQPLVRWDPAEVAAAGKSPVCPVVALDASPASVRLLAEGSEVGTGDPLFVWD